jgi:hypothetical protein
MAANASGKLQNQELEESILWISSEVNILELHMFTITQKD